jgi:hypothetical protein
MRTSSTSWTSSSIGVPSVSLDALFPGEDLADD